MQSGSPISSRAAHCIPWYRTYEGLFRRVAEMEAGGLKVKKMHVAVPEIPPPPAVVEAAERTLQLFPLPVPPVEGTVELREEIARVLREESGMPVDPGTEVLVCGGAMQGLNAALMGVVDPGDEVIMARPGFSPLAEIVKLAGGVPVFVDFEQPDGTFCFAADRYLEAIGPHTKAIILNSPHNPTGCVAEPEQLSALAEAAEKNDLLVISDEVFDCFVFDGRTHVSIASLPGMRSRTIVVNSLSKSHSLYPHRVGFIVGPAHIIEPIKRIHANTVSFISPVAQAMAVAALRERRDWVDHLRAVYSARRNMLLDALGHIPGLWCQKPQGTIVLFPRVESFGLSSSDLASYLLEKAGVLVSPGSAWLSDEHIRLALVLPDDEIREVGRSIGEALLDLAEGQERRSPVLAPKQN